MKHLFPTLVIGLLLGILTAISVGNVFAATTDYVQVQGTSLTYQGQSIRLQGTNFDNVPALGASIGSGNIEDIQITEADYQTLKANGGNHARLGLSFNWYQDDPVQFFQVIDQHITWAREHNVWIVLNMFTTPADCYEGYSATCDIWSSPSQQTELKNFWIDVAQHYHNEPVIAGYDLLNEPNPQGPNYCSTWFTVASEIRNAVYAIAPNQLVFIAACSDPGNSLRYRNPPFGTNIVYEVHDYFPTQLSSNSVLTYPGQATDWFGTCTYNKNAFLGIQQIGDGAGCGTHTNLATLFGLDWSITNTVPLYFGEWGATSSLSGYVQYHQDKAEIYSTWGVSTAHYTWKHKTIITGGSDQWGIYANPLRLDEPLKLAAVQVSWANAIFPDFASSTPTVSLTPLSPDPSSSSTLLFSGSGFGGNDTISSVEYQLDSTAGSWSSCSPTDGAFNQTNESYTCSPPAISDGTHTLNVRLMNGGGMISSIISDTFVVDTSAPTVSLAALTPDPTLDRTPTFTGTATDTTSAIDAVEYQIGGTTETWTACAADDGAFDEASETFSCTVSPPLTTSTHTIYVRARDSLSHHASAVSDTFSIDSDQQWLQTDWIGGGGQDSWNDATKYTAGSTIDDTTTGEFSLESTVISPWYNSGWNYRKIITIDHTKVSGSSDLTNFPVLINLASDAQLSSLAQSSGNDILFTSSDGVTKLSHEIEKYTSSTGELQAWIKIPSLSVSSDTVLYLYYGNSTAIDQQSASSVWTSNNFNGVWHLSQNPTASSPQFSSSVGTGHGTASGLVAGDQIPAQIDGGIDFSSTNDYIQLPDISAFRPTGAMTVSSWIKINSYASSGRIISKTGLSTSRAWTFGLEGTDNSIQFAIAPNNTSLQSVNSLHHPATGTWVHAVGVYEPGVALRVYVNGVLSNSNTTSIAASQFSNNGLAPRIGLRIDNILDFNGSIDEVRLANTARSADWIATEYANQSSPSTFYTLDNPQVRIQYAASGSLTSSIYDTTGAAIWGQLSYTVTTPTNTTSVIKIRTSDSDTMDGAPDFSSCPALSSGTDVSSSSCVDDQHRYVQYQVVLTSTDAFITPTFSNFQLVYSLTNVAPTLSLDSLSNPVTSPVSVLGTATDTDGIITNVEYQLDSDSGSGSWKACSANDGSLNEASERFTCTVTIPADDHTVFTRSKDQSGAYSQVQSVAVHTGTRSVSPSNDTIKTEISAPVCSASPPGNKTPWLYGAIAQSATSVFLYFTPADDPVDHYVVRFGTTSGVYIYGDDNITSSNRVIEISHLSPATTYYFSLRGGNKCAVGLWSNELSVKTKSLNVVTASLDTIQNYFPSQEEKEPVFNDTPSAPPVFEVDDDRGSFGSNNSSDSSLETSNDHQIKIVVKDPSGNRVMGAKVVLHSDPKEDVTNEEGEVTFKDVESGQHQLLISYQGYQAEQSLFVDEQIKELNVNITLQPINHNREYALVGLVVLLLAIIIFLVLRTRKR